MMDNREIIAKNIAPMLKDGDFVNLGIGIPTLVSKYIPKDVTVLLHGENGSIGQDHIFQVERNHAKEWEACHQGDRTNWQTGHKDLGNAGCAYISLIPGGACFDSAVSFAMARGGHLDATILGGLQVDSHGNLANWIVPGKRVNGMGGAMDLVSGAKRVIIAMEHCAKDGSSKILKHCTLPLTAIGCVDVIVTEKCIIEFVDGIMTVTKIAPNVTREELVAMTEATLTFADDVEEMVV